MENPKGAESWYEVSWDLWYNELVFLLIKNHESLPIDEASQTACQRYWRAGYGPAQAFYELIVPGAPCSTIRLGHTT